MIDDLQDILDAETNLKGEHPYATTVEPHLDALLRDVEHTIAAIRRDWGTWDIDTRHDVVNELHCRAQDADNALMDAVRLTDFQAADRP